MKEGRRTLCLGAPLSALPAPPPEPAPGPAQDTRFRGRWRRDWRLAGELIGRGSANLNPEGLWLIGRRTTPLRSLLSLALSLSAWALIALGSGFVLLTTSGLTVRTHKAQILLAPLFLLPLILLSGLLFAALIRRRLQPRVNAFVPWTEVASVASDGRALELVARLPSGPVWGRLKPGFFGRTAARAALARLAQGALPGVVGVRTQRRRSAWVDRLTVLLILGLAAAGLRLGADRWAQLHPDAPPVAAAPGASLSPLASQAAKLTANGPIFPAGANAAQVIDGLSTRGQEVWRALTREAVTADQQAEVDEGFLSALPYGPILDQISMSGSLPRLELLRQRLDGADPSETLGRRALFRIAESYLEALPPDADLWMPRIDVAERWLAVQAGSAWQLDGRAVRVPDAGTAEIYNAVGRFALADLARDVEAASAAGEAPLLGTLRVGLRLQGAGVSLNLQPSSLNKALLAWGTGDFEYVLSRAALKAQQALRDEDAAIASAKKAGYTLGKGWSARDGAVRYATVLRAGRETGWLALFDASKIKASWAFAKGSPATRGALLLSSGAYVTSDGRPAGLAVERGRVDNYLLDRTLGGMVVLGQRGVQIWSLRDGVARPGQGRRLLPMEHLGDLYSTLDALKRAGASAFQTHVLVAGGRLTIQGDRASPELRERRLLITARYGQSPILGVLDIPGNSRMSLYEAAVVAVAALETPQQAGGPGLTVDGVANLDVGSYDILGAWTDEGQRVRKGPVPLEHAKNLIRIARE